MPIDNTTRSPSGTVNVVRPLSELEIDEAIGKRFRSLFGSGTSSEEIQRKLERAQELKTQAELEIERIRKQKHDEDPIAREIFMDCLRRATGNALTAVENTRRILKALDEAGGIRGLVTRPTAPPRDAPVEEWILYLRALYIYLDTITNAANRAFDKQFRKALRRRR